MLSSLEIAVLRRLSVAKQDLALYTLYRIFSLSPAALGKLLTDLRRRQFVDVVEDRVRITDGGIQILVETKKRNRKHEEEVALSESVTLPKLDPSTPYVPLIPRLHKDFFV